MQFFDGGHENERKETKEMIWRIQHLFGDKDNDKKKPQNTKTMVNISLVGLLLFQISEWEETNQQEK